MGSFALWLLVQFVIDLLWQEIQGWEISEVWVLSPPISFILDCSLTHSPDKDPRSTLNFANHFLKLSLQAKEWYWLWLQKYQRVILLEAWMWNYSLVDFPKVSPHHCKEFLHQNLNSPVWVCQPFPSVTQTDTDIKVTLTPKYELHTFVAFLL